MIDLNQYENNISDFTARGREKSGKLNVVGTVRVGWFLSFLVVFVYLINIRQLSLAIISFFVFLLVFGLLVILYNRLKFSLEQSRHLVRINEIEIKRHSADLSDLADGSEYLEEHHPYAVDLDIFGHNSIFQLINRTATVPGKQLLAARLKGGSLSAEHTAYQEAVKEMAGLPRFMQEYQALGMHFELGKEDYDKFNNWLQDEEKISPLISRLGLLYVLPALFLTGFVVITLFSITYYALLPIIAVNLYLLGVHHARTSKVVEQTSSVVKLLNTYIKHIRLIKSADFRSGFVGELRSRLSNTDHDAEQEIHQLSRLLDQLQARTNLLHIFINIPLLLDLQWLTRLAQWKKVKSNHLSSWLSTLAEFEVLVSLGGTAYMNNEWCYPAFTDEDYILIGKDFGHPLISHEKRVSNDFSMHGTGRAMIITGPNMAGKSTFLRTMALNVVMAKMGGTVCAETMTLSHDMNVFTAMRTQDNLSENISSFYAELDRIRQLLKEIESGNKTLYFLDELLKGTNSADRHKGAEALVKQLISLKVAGFVSTHDIELGELTRELDKVSNYSFESTITDGQIEFDYKIREGICSSFNASELMRQMGIEV